MLSLQRKSGDQSAVRVDSGDPASLGQVAGPEPMPMMDASKATTAPGKGEMSMNPAGRRLVDDDERAAPVTILDGLGRVIQTIPAEEFRRIHGVAGRPTNDNWRRRRERVKKSEIEEGAIEDAVPG